MPLGVKGQDPHFTQFNAAPITINPNYVWFMFIIFFNLYYNFKLVSSIATSLSNEFSDRNIAVDEKRPGETIGFINSIFLVLWFINAFTKFDPGAVNFILSLGALITWIIYWVKIRKYKMKTEIKFQVLNLISIMDLCFNFFLFCLWNNRIRFNLI